MRLTRASDYAVRIMVYLARQPEAARATRGRIIQETGVPAAFLNKLVQKLVRAGLLLARPGVQGGCALASPAGSIPILRIIESIDGPVLLSDCLEDQAVCPNAGYCGFRRLLGQLQSEMIRILSSTTLADMAHQGAISGSPRAGTKLP